MIEMTKHYKHIKFIPERYAKLASMHKLLDIVSSFENGDVTYMSNSISVQSVDYEIEPIKKNCTVYILLLMHTFLRKY